LLKFARQLIASPLDIRSWKERVRYGELLTSLNQGLSKHKILSPPCVSIVLANSALVYSRLMLRGRGRCHPLSKCIGYNRRVRFLRPMHFDMTVLIKIRWHWFGCYFSVCFLQLRVVLRLRSSITCLGKRVKPARSELWGVSKEWSMP
jgi:hypothetical protein